jgi:hypothetical protein
MFNEPISGGKTYSKTIFSITIKEEVAMHAGRKVLMEVGTGLAQLTYYLLLYKLIQFNYELLN